MKQSYPRLKTYCREEHGYEFQAIDMRWGVQDLSVLDHTGPQICYEEVELCRKISMGPHFILILGQRYGSPEIPFNIPPAQQDYILDTLAMSTSIAHDVVEAVQRWYVLDWNTVPVVYQLRPIIEFPQIASSKQISAARELWDRDEPKLRTAFEYVVSEWTREGELSRRDALRFSCSVTEHELICGAADMTVENRTRMAAFVRCFENIEAVRSSSQATRFLDLQSDKVGCIDVAKYDRSQRLIHEVLPSLLPSSNLRFYTVPWEAIERDGPQRNRYLHKFGMDFEAKLRAMIDRSVQKEYPLESDETRNEVLAQLRLCVDCVRSFQGRHELLDAIKNYIIGDSTEPLVLYGSSGSGKSSLMAQAATLSRGWVMGASKQPVPRKSKRFASGKWDETLRQIMPTLRRRDHDLSETLEIQSDAIIIVRFLGTSPLNSSIVQTLKCVCKQLMQILISMEFEYELTPRITAALQLESLLNECQTVINLFYELLAELSTRNQWVVIFLDAIDQLDPSDAAYQVNWLRSPLPAKVRFVVSTLPDYGGILMALKSRLAAQLQATDVTEVSPEHGADSPSAPLPLLLNPKFFILVSQLDVDVCMQVLFTSLKTSDRALRPFQYRLVRRAFEHCQLSIFVELVANKVSKWHSWDLPSWIAEEDDSLHRVTLENISHIRACSNSEAERCAKERPNLSLALNIRDAIVAFFQQLEIKHGTLFTTHALSFITASRHGLSAGELEDILSLDDDVLRGVFQHHVPPQIRSPPILWIRLRNSVGPYLVERDADGVHVYSWYHRQFTEVANEYFFSDESYRQKIHSLLADYFLGTWIGKKKTFMYPPYMVKKLKIPESAEEDRSKLLEDLRLPNDFYETRHSHLTSTLHDHTARSQTIANVTADEHVYVTKPSLLRSSAVEVYNAVRIAAISLNSNPHSLSVDLLGRLSRMPITLAPVLPHGDGVPVSVLGKQMQSKQAPLPPKQEDLEYLLTQCRDLAARDCPLVPRGPCFDSGSGLLHIAFDVGLSFACIMSNQLILTIALNDQLVCWYDLDGNLVKCLQIPSANFTLFKSLVCFEAPPSHVVTILATEERAGGKTDLEQVNNATEEIQDKKSPILMEVDLFSGRSSILDELDFLSTRPFNLSNAVFTARDWIVAIDGDRLYIADVLLRRVLVDGKVILRGACYFSHRHKALGFTTKSGVFLLDFANSRSFSLADVGRRVYSTVLLSDGHILNFSSFQASGLRGFWFEFFEPLSAEQCEQEEGSVTASKTDKTEIGLDFGPRLQCQSSRRYLKIDLGLTFERELKNVSVFTSSRENLVCFLFNVYRVHAVNFGLVWDGRREAVVELSLPFDASSVDLLRDQKLICEAVLEHTLKYGSSGRAVFTLDNDLLITTGQSCLLLVWSVNTGHLLRVLKQGNTEGLLIGLTCVTSTYVLPTGTKRPANQLQEASRQRSLIGVCYFSEEGEGKRRGSTSAEGSAHLLVMCKLYYADALTVPDSELSQAGALFALGEEAEEALVELEVKDRGESDKVTIEDEQQQQHTGQPSTASILLQHPLIYLPDQMSLEYLHEDVLPTLFLLQSTRGGPTRVESLSLHDVDEASTNVIKTWPTEGQGVCDFDSFVSVDLLPRWPSSPATIALRLSTLAMLHSLVIFDAAHPTSGPHFSACFLNAHNISDFLPNLYMPTQTGNVKDFGLIDEAMGLLLLLRPINRCEGLELELLIYDDATKAMLTPWGDRIRSVSFQSALQSLQNAGQRLLSKPSLERPIISQVAWRPNHAGQVLVCLCEGLKSLSVATRRDGRVPLWLGVCVIMDLGSGTSTSHPHMLSTMLLDIGPKLLFPPDGLSVINYRLGVYDLEEGRRIRDLSTGLESVTATWIDRFLFHSSSLRGPTTSSPGVDSADSSGEEGDFEDEVDWANDIENPDAVILQNLLLVNDGKLICGQRHCPEEALELTGAKSEGGNATGDNDVNSTQTYVAQPPRQFMLFSATAGGLRGSYLFEKTPDHLLASRDNRTILMVTANDCIRTFDIAEAAADGINRRGIHTQITPVVTPPVQDSRIPPTKAWDVFRPEENESQTKLQMQAILQESGICEALRCCLLQVVTLRPRDPIRFIAEYLQVYHKAIPS
nr:unnamed protein product [Spirometra erinaceieuropaei]